MNKKVYVGHEYRNRVTVIDEAPSGYSNQVTVIDNVAYGYSHGARVGRLSWPVAVALNPKTDKVYVGIRDNSVVTIDGSSNGLATIPIFGWPTVLAASAATGRVYAAPLYDGDYCGDYLTVIESGNSGRRAVSLGIDPLRPPARRWPQIAPYCRRLSQERDLHNDCDCAACQPKK